MGSKISRFENIQVLRGIAVMMVVLFHIHALESQYFHAITLMPDFFDVGTAGVDIFFVVSGFIMIEVTRGKFQQPVEIFRFIYNRIARIYPIYWFYSLLLLLVFFIHPAWINHLQADHHLSMVRSFLLIPQETLPLLTVSWTLIHEMYFYVVMTGLLLLPEKFLLQLLGLWALFVMVSHFLGTAHSATLLLMTHPLTIEFIAGCLIAKFHAQGKKLSAWCVFVLGIITFLGVGYAHFLPSDVRGGWPRIILFGTPSVLLVYGGVLLEHHKILISTLLRKLGNASYSIYLSHLFVLSVLGRMYAVVVISNPIVHMAALILELIVVMVVGWLSFHYLENPLTYYFSHKIKKTQLVLANSAL